MLKTTHNDYKHLVEIRAKEKDTNDNKMIVEGKAIAYDTETVLFEVDGIEYKEIIKCGAFKNADLKDAFFKYNHNDNVMVMARYKNKTLQFEEREDGVYIKAELANTSQGRDLYELIKRGDIDKMSFAFTIKNESYDKETRTWTVNEIDKIYDVAAVPVPAYEDTNIYARRYADVESLRVEDLEKLRMQKISELKSYLSKEKKY